MARFTYALVRMSPEHPLVPQTYSVISRHETLDTALRAFDRKRGVVAKADYRLMTYDRFGRLDGNGYLTIPELRASVAAGA